MAIPNLGRQNVGLIVPPALLLKPVLFARLVRRIPD